ncbi:Wadjet anti-phage system protein JetD domain-containing protein [Paraburkholderia sp. BCC1886]|uniref:Wadjet anti-phage system protein JetD domain-containing protein n=1 Tax=Paraburkholderia sp. BCC1886 TaxID=2562670 RepID=UPI001183BEC6|nr:Wadjet anti-phage system protein JetD domain-containing protein [Paraburkholderia sp. BCC1886]
MSWTTPDELRAQVNRLWERGELLGNLALESSSFPKRLVLKGPTSMEIAERFDEVREWSGSLRGMPHCRVEMREFRHRVFGANALPNEAWVDSFDEAVALIGKQRDAARFAALLSMTNAREPRLVPWLARKPLRALELAGIWERMLDVCAWIERHPRPNVYLRQIDIADVHTKFIESQRSVLAELFELILPGEAVDAERSGSSQFSLRYGFRDKPLRIRFRMLDASKALFQPGTTEQDITLDAVSFARLDPDVSRVFITENEVNFLAFPAVADSMVVFGAGYGFEMLAGASWLVERRVFYWGDIDTHGFAILDQLRGLLGHVESFLMDRETLMAFASLWDREEKQTVRDLPRLTQAERALYDDLRDNRLRANIRLEQERVGFGWVERALGRG